MSDRVRTHRWLVPVVLVISGCAGSAATSSLSPPRRQVLREGQTLLEEGRRGAAREAFLACVSPAFPPSLRGEAYLGLGRMELDGGEPREAIRYLTEARALLDGHPEEPSAEILLAQGYVELSAFQLALNHLQAAFPYLREGPGRRRAACLLSLLLGAAGEKERAAHYHTLAGNRRPPEYARWHGLIFPPMPKRARPARAAARTAKKRSTEGVPRVHSRKEWGARPMRRNARPMGKISRVTIHHTGGGEGIGSPRTSEIKSYLKRLQRYDQKSRHWADIAYHYLIDASGRIWEGRPIRFQGAHAGNPDANRGNVGIALVGNFDRERPTAPQLETLRRLVADLRKRHGLSARHIHTHKKVKERYHLPATNCPGRNLLKALPAIIN
ncbi:MAG: N-acetylmuramoyl-L-alanine amidase [Planctomycetota bacterium]